MQGDFSVRWERLVFRLLRVVKVLGGEVEVGKRFADCFSSTQTTILASTSDYTNRFSLSDIQLIGGRKKPGEIRRKAIFFVELHANFLQGFLVIAFLSEKGG